VGPNWQPLDQLEIVAEHIGGMTEHLVDQLESLKEGLDRPGALDDATITRVQRVYGEQLDDLWVFQEQIRRWDSETLTDTQHVTVTGLGIDLAGARVTLTQILEVAKQLKTQTIETILAKSDLELGLEALLGGLQPPRPDSPTA
jgi:hypothetical protein